MITIRLFDWNALEIDNHSALLTTAGFVVDSTPIDQESLRVLRSSPPQAVVIALDRRPSQGRDLGLLLRKTKATRLVPLVFVNGTPEKVQEVRKYLPDACYTNWDRLVEDLKAVIAIPVVNPVVPGSVFDPYAGTPLPKKLGIRPGSLVYLHNAPENFESTLGQLPKDAILTGQQPEYCDVLLWFVKEQVELNQELATIAGYNKSATIWIIWPKKSSGVNSDLSQPLVRATGLAAGLVDYKVCSVDPTWTGLCFRWRK